VGNKTTRHTTLRSKPRCVSSCGEDMYGDLFEGGAVGVSRSITTNVGSFGRNWRTFITWVSYSSLKDVDWRFLATSVGFHYLTEIGYIDQEIDDWFHGRNEEFVRSLEANYERSLNIDDDDTERYPFPSRRME